LLNEVVKTEVVETSIKSQDDTTTTTVSPCLKEPKPKTTKVKRKLIMNQSLNQDASQNHKLTEYFAVRRSVRKPKTAILEEKQKCLEEAVESGKEDGLQVQYLSKVSMSSNAVNNAIYLLINCRFIIFLEKVAALWQAVFLEEENLL
jgi:hypothetical protein